MDADATAHAPVAAMPQCAALRSIPAEASQVKLFAQRMRQADQDEVRACDGMEPERVLLISLRRSYYARAVFIGDEPLAMWGLVSERGGVVRPWCLTTTAVDRYPLAFWRESKRVVRGIAKSGAQVLVQCIDGRYTAALRWMRRLGFHVDAAPHPCGALQLPFHRAILFLPGKVAHVLHLA